MPLLQDSLTVPKEKNVESNGDPYPTPRRKIQAKYIWSQIFGGVFVLILALGGGGLISLMKRAETASQAAIHDFSWMVLVRGESLDMDEVGRFLKQLPGATDVTFVSNQEAFLKLQADPLYLGDTDTFSASDLPSSWRVRWDPANLDFSQLDLWMEDAKHMNSVVDVAYDRNTVNEIKKFRSFWYQTQIALSTMMLVGIVLSVFMLGRYLFFTSAPFFNSKKFFTMLLVDQLWWCGGILFVSKVIGPIPWPLWLVGLGVGILHYIWTSLEHV